MAYLDAADCAVRVKNRLNRPTSEQAYTRSTTDDVLYEMMTEANDHIVKRIATFIPDAMISAPVELVSTDSGKTYDFPDDADSNAAFALGHFKLYENQESIPDYPLVAGVDFTVESTNTADGGTVIRIPARQTRTFTDGGPYAQYVAPSNVITSSTQPTIPKFARKPMVADMARQAFDRLGLDSAGAEADFQREWLETLAAIRTQASGKYGRTLRYRSRRFLRNST